MTQPDPAELRRLLEQFEAHTLQSLLIVATSELSPVAYGRFVDTVTRLVMQSKGRQALRFADDPSLLADVDAIVREMKSDARTAPRRLDELFARLNRAWTREHATYSAGVGAFSEALYRGVDLGQDELYIEVLETDFTEVGRRYLVSVYLTTAPEQRAARSTRRASRSGCSSVVSSRRSRRWRRRPSSRCPRSTSGPEGGNRRRTSCWVRL